MLVAILGVFAVVDFVRPPAAQLSARATVRLIGAYQAAVSPVLGKLGVRCRFEPTCSHYAQAVIARHGFVTGTAKAAYRVLRCGPWTKAGTYDPPA